MKSLYIVSLWLHILSATLWIGGSLFLTVVLMPVVRQWEHEHSMDLVLRTARRFLWIGWSCFGVLILTGAFNLVYLGIGWEQLLGATFWQSPFGEVLAGKLALVLLILVLSATHDFILGPLTTRRIERDPTSEEAQRLRLLARWVGRVNLLLGLIVVGLAVMLGRGWPW